MKKLIFTAAAITTTLFANAQTEIKQAKPTEAVASVENPDKVPIKIEDLPGAVQKTIKSDAYMGWTPGKAYVVKSDVPYYEVEFTNKKSETNWVKFKEDGSVIK